MPTSITQVVVLDEADKLFELGKESHAAAAANNNDSSSSNNNNSSSADDKSFLGQVDEILAACSHPKVYTVAAPLGIYIVLLYSYMYILTTKLNPKTTITTTNKQVQCALCTHATPN